MREYQSRTVQELAACTCDRCQRRLTPDDGEWQERLSFDHVCGFDSVFGDGNAVSLDLCQHCVREVLGQWLHIGHPADAGGPGDQPMRRLGGLRGKIRIAKDFDAPLPDDVLRGSVKKSDHPTKPVDVEWKAEKPKKRP